MQTYAYGFPKLGKNREFKTVVESFWNGVLSPKALIDGVLKIQTNNNAIYKKNIDKFPDREISLYDPILDTAIMVGAFHAEDIKSYYNLCRDEIAFEMKKWFNTNYHYLVPDFTNGIQKKFELNWDHFALLGKSRSQCPSLIGPFTFLKLSKGIDRETFRDKFLELVLIYRKILKLIPKLHLEEPSFVFDLEDWEIDLIKEGYAVFEESASKIVLMTYYDSVDWIDTLLDLPVGSIGLDFVRGKDSLNAILKNGFPSQKTLIAGLVDGRNVWKNDIRHSVLTLKSLKDKVQNLVVSNAGPLFHLPVSLKGEEEMDPRLRSQLAFAEEKLEEIRLIAEAFDREDRPLSEEDDQSSEAYGFDADVQKRVEALKAKDFKKEKSLKERRVIQKALLDLPPFPTTTIGSFPQTKDLREKRSLRRKGELSAKEYESFIRSKIDELIAFQESCALDVLVHGEFERTDMVEFFAKSLKGIATTQGAWVLSYGTRVYRPPIIYGDVSRPSAMAVREVVYAQRQTKKHVKGMLTGPVTIIAWSFCREDISTQDVSYQIALSIRDEIRDYESEGIKIVQVDEAAFREKSPIKKRDWEAYFDWAIRSFNLATNTLPETQIHTHMCYSKFAEIMHYIAKMDFDVISIEASKSRGEVIEAFENIDFEAQIGLGVWDIHSVAIPSREKMIAIVKRSLKSIPADNFWLNPDCGLKTRGWSETKASLKNMVDCAESLRKSF